MNSSKLKTIGILQTGKVGGDLGEKYGEFPEMFITLLGEETFDYEIFPVVEGVFPNSPDECDGWIVTGSKHGAYEDHSWIAPLEEFIRQLVASGVPTLGICFGHQIMAQAMGGVVEKHPSGWGIGVQEYKDLETGTQARLLAFHQDQVIIAPKGTETTHTSDFCTYAGLRYSKTCFSLQPHPEHIPEFSHDLLMSRRGTIIPEEVTDTALNSIDSDNTHKEYAHRLREFFLSN